jgi:phosphopantothenoylcysteine decarboxylase/phosphopantothenate--cysteine ligase
MSGPLSDRHIVLGICGSIASYKAADITSRLIQAGAHVDVAMTPAAREFITPLTFRALTGRQPYVDMFRDGAEGEAHVELARRADLMLIAPASASTMARLAHGLADDFVSLTALATVAPLLVAPAMDSQMWEHPATEANCTLLAERGVEFLGPVAGRLASGRVGAGRLMEPEEIVDRVKARLGRERGDLAGRRIVVTAGGTREAIDPVRYVGNRSSGKMGYALAEAARDRGASVTLITSAGLPKPAGIDVVTVESAADMLDAVQAACTHADALIMAAAVADYRPAEAAQQKIKKDGQERRSIELVETTDIIASVKGDLVKVAFAAETQDLLANAQKKLASKGAQFVVANDVTAADAGFAVDTNRVTIIDAEGGRESLPLMLKYDVSLRVLDRVAVLLRKR